MALLRVILLELRPRLANLLDHEVMRVTLNNLLDGAVFVPGNDDEAEALLDDALVLLWRDRKLLDARRVAALTVKRDLSFDVVLLGTFVDALVDGSEDLFVSGGSLRELHSPMIARLAVDDPFDVAATQADRVERPSRGNDRACALFPELSDWVFWWAFRWGVHIPGEDRRSFPRPVTPPIEGEIYVQSAAHRSLTVVTVMAFIFTPMLKGNHWVDALTGKTTETHTEQCQPGDPCPARKHITQKIALKP